MRKPLQIYRYQATLQMADGLMPIKYYQVLCMNQSHTKFSLLGVAHLGILNHSSVKGFEDSASTTLGTAITVYSTIIHVMLQTLIGRL